MTKSNLNDRASVTLKLDPAIEDKKVCKGEYRRGLSTDRA